MTQVAHQISPSDTSDPTPDYNPPPRPATQAELVKSLVDAGVHFGHRVSRWNPKMEPYIHGKRNMIHIIDVKQTLRGLLLAKKLLQNTVAQGRDVLFVGTKRQARHAIEEEARRCGMHYVSRSEERRVGKECRSR